LPEPSKAIGADHEDDDAAGLADASTAPDTIVASTADKSTPRADECAR